MKVWQPVLKRLGVRCRPALPDAAYLCHPGHFDGGEHQRGGPDAGAQEPGDDPGKIQSVCAESDPDGREGAAGIGSKKRNVSLGFNNLYCIFRYLCGFLVVPTGLFPVKTGIYMPNNFKGLNRKPFDI